MTALVEGAKKLVGRGSSDVAVRVEGLERAVTAGRGRLDDGLVDDAAGVVERAGTRLKLSAEHTVVALAGATGSGKSSTFNALTGLDLAAVGVRRPTTSWTMACTWGAEGSGELLDWLGVPKRHQVSRNSMLDAPVSDDRDLQGLVLLDLPDHDSTEVSHHVEVDRLVRLTDMLVWVLDPQKYADAAIHDRYLRPLASHKDVMLVVLNHIDEVPEDRRASMVDDLQRLLDADGLAGVPVIATSARHGDGIPELKQAIAARVAAKKATKARLLADVTDAARSMQTVSGTAKPTDVARARKNELVDAFADAAGVPTVVHAVEQATRVRANRATGWPVTAWLGKLRPDPLKRLHLDLGRDGRLLTGAARASVPEASQVQRARVDTAVRAVADDAAAELTLGGRGTQRVRLPAARPERRAGQGGLHHRPRRLADPGVVAARARPPVGADPHRARRRAVARRARGDGLPAAARAGDAGLPGLPGADADAARGVAGIVLALLCRVLTGLSARAKARSADRRLRTAIGEVTERLVVEPIEEEPERLPLRPRRPPHRPPLTRPPR